MRLSNSSFSSISATIALQSSKYDDMPGVQIPPPPPNKPRNIRGYAKKVAEGCCGLRSIKASYSNISATFFVAF
jgi:hypothetical protein